MAINPYLNNGRLAQVIAAITALGNYRYYKLSFEKCAERISNKPEDGDHWGKILSEHPEFFRISETERKASLVWRRQHPKTYHVRKHTEIPAEEYRKLNQDDQDLISRRPLAAEEITALIGVAVSLHERALEQSKARKWWVPIATAILAFVGALSGTWLAKPSTPAQNAHFGSLRPVAESAKQIGSAGRVEHKLNVQIPQFVRVGTKSEASSKALFQGMTNSRRPPAKLQAR